MWWSHVCDNDECLVEKSLPDSLFLQYVLCGRLVLYERKRRVFFLKRIINFHQRYIELNVVMNYRNSVGVFVENARVCALVVLYICFFKGRLSLTIDIDLAVIWATWFYIQRHWACHNKSTCMFFVTKCVID